MSDFRFFFVLVSLLLYMGCKKTKTVRTVTDLLENPAEAPRKRKVIASLRRGEYVNFVKERSFGGKRFMFVELPDIDDKGWVSSSDLLDGKLKNVVVTRDSTLFKRPSFNSTKAGIIKAGQRAFLLKTQGDFLLIQYPPKKKGYISKENIGQEGVPIVTSVEVRGLGRASVSASSHYVPSVGKELIFHPKNLFDNDPKTSWCEGRETDSGIGEWVEIEFENPQSISSMGFITGSGYNARSFSRNGRVAKVAIDIGDGQVHTSELDVENYGKVHAMSLVEEKTVTSIRINITDVIQANKLTCMSEISFNVPVPEYSTDEIPNKEAAEQDESTKKLIKPQETIEDQ